jgi:hypothetical protein
MAYQRIDRLHTGIDRVDEQRRPGPMAGTIVGHQEMPSAALSASDCRSGLATSQSRRGRPTNGRRHATPDRDTNPPVDSRSDLLSDCGWSSIILMLGIELLSRALLPLPLSRRSSAQRTPPEPPPQHCDQHAAPRRPDGSTPASASSPRRFAHYQGQAVMRTPSVSLSGGEDVPEMRARRGRHPGRRPELAGPGIPPPTQHTVATRRASDPTYRQPRLDADRISLYRHH